MSVLNALTKPLRSAHRWLVYTPKRALDRAYEAALKIQELENRYFEGAPVGNGYSANVDRLFHSDLDRHLQTIKVSTIEFDYSLYIVEVFKPSVAQKIRSAPFTETDVVPNLIAPVETTEVLRKLQIIDAIAAKYTAEPLPPPPPPDTKPVLQREPASRFGSPLSSPFLTKTPRVFGDDPNNKLGRKNVYDPSSTNTNETDGGDRPMKTMQTSFVPRSILRTLDRLKRELDPNAETEVVEKFRYYKDKTVISLKFVLLLILIPLLTHQISKNFIIEPIYDRLADDRVPTFLNQDMEEEAFLELNRYEERLQFRILIGETPTLTAEEIEDRVVEEAHEIAAKYRKQSDNAIKNVFADLSSLVAFSIVLVTSKQEVAILKSFMDDIIYGLSDSAKAFIIILFTDMFVGYHSPHGWEVILEGVARHFGLPESRDFNFMFIATFPVILDTVVKYWIFRYLNRISPSAVATYRNMNE